MDGTNVRDICIKEQALEEGQEEEGAFAVVNEVGRRAARDRVDREARENRGRAVSLVRKRFQFE